MQIHTSGSVTFSKAENIHYVIPPVFLQLWSSTQTDKPLAATNILRALLNPAWKCMCESKGRSSSGVVLGVHSLAVATVRHFRRRVCCSQGHREMLKKVSPER